MARGRLSPAETLFKAEDFLVEAVVFIAVLCESLLQALFRVVGRHDCCDSGEDADCYDGFDHRGHSCEGGVGWSDGVVGSLAGRAVAAVALLLVGSQRESVVRGLLCDCGCVVLLSRAGWSGTVMCGDDSGLCFVRMTGIHVFDVVDEAEPFHVAWAASYDHHNEVPTESRDGM